MRGVSPSSAARSSIVWLATVPTVIGTPTAADPRALASSPSGWTIVCTPIGASATGAGQSKPRSEVERSRRLMSRRTRGTIRQAPNARSFSRAVSSLPAEPNT